MRARGASSYLQVAFLHCASHSPEKEDAMQLVADRFVIRADGDAVDLATGLRVWLRVTCSDAATDVRWSATADTFARLQHQAIAPLVDYGAIGRAERFEAWQCGSVWDGAESAAHAVRSSVAAFFRAAGVATNDPGFPVHVRAGAPVVVPVVAECDETFAPVDAPDMPLDERGIHAIDRLGVAALAEMFRRVDGPRLHVASIWGPSGSGRTWVVRQLARLARLNGFIPVSTDLIDSEYRDAWRGRSLFLIDDGAERGWPALVESAMRAPRPHVMVIVGDTEIRGVDGIRLDPVGPDALVDAVRPRPLTPALGRDLQRCAERAEGWPGRFARLVWRVPSGQSRQRSKSLPRVAEQPVAYGGDERPTVPVAVRPPASWPVPGELALLRRRAVDAERQLAAGRHASAIRALRQVAAAFARRDAWGDAAAAGLRLARALLGRGRLAQLDAVLNEARTHALRGGDHAQLLEAAVLAAELSIDRAQIDEAESVLLAASATASALGEGAAHDGAAIALARTHFWRGRYEEAFAALDRVSAGACRTVDVRRRRWRAKVAIARGDTARALRAITDLLTDAETAGARDQAAILQTAAEVSLAAGDVPVAVDRATAAIRASRAARDPLRTVRARIVLAEALRRQGLASAASMHARWLGRYAPTLPPLLRARLNPADHLRTLRPLALLLPRDPGESTGLPVVDQMIAIVRACQVADDELVVLRDVCTHLRDQLYAAAVAFVAAGTDRAGIIAGDGPRADVDVACRAIDAGIVIQPHRHGDRIVAAAPVQYAGSTIGALSARWTIGSTHDASTASAVLASTAVTAAPILATALARRERIVEATGRELLGATASIDQVRRLVDRAAVAPFPVLIVGESGCGKELVARAIHRGSPRRDRPFRTLNCAAIPDDLADAEFFGHVRGAFTGAVGDRTGVFEEAHGGTLFLDEVGELTPRAQAKLLRVLQEGEIRRVGENLARRVDVRVVAATNRDVHGEADRGAFRRDLLYRLDVIRIALPPLRERTEDIPMLVDHAWRDAAARVGSRATLSTSAIAALAHYSWPGNVRELQNVLAALAVRCPKRGVVPATALPPAFTARHESVAWRLEEARRTFEERFVRAALARTGGHRGRAAAELGVSRQGLTKLMSRLGIS
jgi:DNA-binding NtrC family response regulator/tetratricopeptide (TPR) repeat protein